MNDGFWFACTGVGFVLIMIVAAIVTAAERKREMTRGPWLKSFMHRSGG